VKVFELAFANYDGVAHATPATPDFDSTEKHGLIESLIFSV